VALDVPDTAGRRVNFSAFTKHYCVSGRIPTSCRITFVDCQLFETTCNIYVSRAGA
jgi:hypothetical protein